MEGGDVFCFQCKKRRAISCCSWACRHTIKGQLHLFLGQVWLMYQKGRNLLLQLSLFNKALLLSYVQISSFTFPHKDSVEFGTQSQINGLYQCIHTSFQGICFWFAMCDFLWFCFPIYDSIILQIKGYMHFVVMLSKLLMWNVMFSPDGRHWVVLRHDLENVKLCGLCCLCGLWLPMSQEISRDDILSSPIVLNISAMQNFRG
mgnify:FL=1